ncbi:WYL domain-containing transcriptional regulator [Aggregatibacter actinomycetemcomitans]|uniref:helix-turn-helix transcriptional regulator n=1 Tax=Aggregatibacter actinomycetemcomitans TaxID=714 RepID=UPI00197BA9AD|nr:WYL domain-containing transcriptional regulator [Aggregatibacter actinomycetemcomitans]MBN6068994.1 WYL domain-containing transcriptional regulator [Aggregatibacter actinomycetemcomitans]
MTSKNERLALRLAEILIELNTRGQVDITELAERFSIGTRTLQKDLNVRLAFLNWEKAGPRYYSINQNQLGVFTQSDIQRFARFASVQNLFPKLDREFFQHSLTESIKVKGFQYESIQHRQKEFKLLQQAIEHHQVVEFSYKKQGHPDSNRTLEPYILLNKNGIWYLIGLENGKEKTFCFSQIHFLKPTKQTFTPKPEFLEKISQSDSISHGNQLDEVIIKVDAKVAHYFTRRALLPNQEIIRHIENGELLIAYKNIHEMEIIPPVQYWLPHLTIVSPDNLQEKLVNKLKNYISAVRN